MMSWEEMVRKMMNRLLVVTLAAVVAIEILSCTAPVNAAKGPVITSISPSSVIAGGAGFTLTVNGSNFNGNSNVLWNGAQRPTVAINSTQLQAFISKTDIATGGTVQITVVDPKPFPRQSNPTSLTISSVSLTITTSSLPTAVVQLPYSAAVTNSGGIAPYTWKLVSGQLPPGLALGSTSGAISGIPGQTGSYGFTTEVIDSSPTPQTASQTLAVSVTAPSLLSINTTTLTNGTVQVAYSATLAASGGVVPYSWSLVSGSLPPGLMLSGSTGAIAGIPTAAGQYSFTVQVKDSAASTASQAFTVSIAASPLQITTTSLPGGTVGVAYSATLAASGGVPPYSWSISAGALPNSLSLASTGAITGTPSVAGTFNFTVMVTDSVAAAARNALSILISSSSSSTYSSLISSSSSSTYTSRTDLNAAPETIPALCSPAPCIMTSSDLNANLKYTRVTDSNTVSANPSDWFATNGSAEQMEWNSDNTLFYVNNPIHGVNHFFKLNASTQTVTEVTCSFSGADCWNGVLTTITAKSDGPMSGVSPYVYYAIDDATRTKIMKMDFSAVIGSGGSNADTMTTIADATTCPSIPTTASGSIVTMNDNDTRWGMGFGGSGQDTWTVIYIWDATLGCRWLNLANSTTGGSWGPTGATTLFDEAGSAIASQNCSQIHNVRMDRDGRWARITTNCTNGYLFFWDIATGNLYRDAYNNVAPYYGGGHLRVGFDNVYVNVDTDYTNLKWFTKRTIPPLGLPTWLTSGRSAFDDSHITWNNQTKGNLQPIIVSLYQTSAPTQAWGDEIIGVSMDGSGTVYRFAHQYTRAHDFNAQAIANVSRDGKWAIFCSDWSTSRDDVFLVALK